MATTTVDTTTREDDRFDTLNDKVRHAIIFLQALERNLGEMLRLLEEAKTAGKDRP
jgi:hypothetical protein